MAMHSYYSIDEQLRLIGLLVAADLSLVHHCSSCGLACFHSCVVNCSFNFTYRRHAKFDLPLLRQQTANLPNLSQSGSKGPSGDLNDNSCRLGKGVKSALHHKHRRRPEPDSHKGSFNDLSAPLCPNIDIPGVSLSPEHFPASPQRCRSPNRFAHRKVEGWRSSSHGNENVNSSWPPYLLQQTIEESRVEQIKEDENNSQFPASLSHTIISSNWEASRSGK